MTSISSTTVSVLCGSLPSLQHSGNLLNLLFDELDLYLLSHSLERSGDEAIRALKTEFAFCKAGRKLGHGSDGRRERDDKNLGLGGGTI